MNIVETIARRKNDQMRFSDDVDCFWTRVSGAIDDDQIIFGAMPGKSPLG